MVYFSDMKDQSFETRADVLHQTEESGVYSKYQELGGIINEKDYRSALARAEKAVALNAPAIRQAEDIAEYAGIVLDNSNGVDPKVKLYAVLRADYKPEDEENHHSQMSDQRLFAEVVRMLGDIDSLNKMTTAHPNISF